MRTGFALLGFCCLLVLARDAGGESGTPKGVPIDMGRVVNFDPVNVDLVYQAHDIRAEPTNLVLSSPKGLTEFTPIQNTIVQSDTQHYSFNVNTSIGLGEFYEFLIFLTGNICTQPSNIQVNDTGLAVYYSFNSSMFDDLEVGQMSLFENGYFQALADVPVATPSSDNESIVYIAVRAPENTNSTAVWSYQIAVSQNDLVFQWDDKSWAQVVDTDESSALIVTGNLTVDYSVTSSNVSSLNVSDSQYALFLYSYDYKDYFSSLNMSWCAVRNGPALTDIKDYETSYTYRNGMLQQQFYVSGLNSSTTYIGYFATLKDDGTLGGAVYQQFQFETLDSPVCELIYELPFCEQVAYSVPASSNMTKAEVTSLYDDQAKSLYTNFSKALQQIPCDTTNDAVFSPMTSCDNCADSYKDWLCSVTIPRCTTRNITGSKLREVNQSRNAFIDQYALPSLPYYEILPCVNVCQAIVRDCPADFNFYCPTTNASIELSYYWDIAGSDYSTCNYVGNKQVQSSNAFKLIASRYLLILVVVVSVCI